MIDRRVRELQIQSDILPLDTTALSLKKSGYKGIIISGGPSSIYDEDAPSYDPYIFQIGIPILGRYTFLFIIYILNTLNLCLFKGICYGFHMINKEFGGVVRKESVREDGQTDIYVENICRLFK